MECQESSIYEKFTWKIENFSHLNVDKIYSEPFILGGYPWKIILFPNGNKEKDAVNKLSIYLKAMKTTNMSEGWSREVKFRLSVFDQVEADGTITIETKHYFNANEHDWGFKSFMTLTELHDPKEGFIVNNACIVGAEVFVYKSSNEKKVNQTVNLNVSLAFGCQTGHMEVEVPRPESESTNVETLSPVSKVVCNESTKQVDATLGYAALGRVIYFLKTRKVKDMNEQACKELQVLWDELEKFQFDVTWLEPHVKYALGVKSYVEKALEVEKLKENTVVLKLEIERLKAKSFAAKVNLDAERNLLKAKGFEKIDLDSQLGCGS